MIIQYYGVEMITRDLPQVFLENISKIASSQAPIYQKWQMGRSPCFYNSAQTSSVLPRSWPSFEVLDPGPLSCHSILVLDPGLNHGFDRVPRP